MKKSKADIKKKGMVRAIGTIAIIVLILTAAACKEQETPTPEQFPTFTPTVTVTHTPAPTVTPTFTATPYPADPATWDVTNSTIVTDPTTGVTSYLLQDWQINFVLPVVTESFNKLYIYADHNVTPDEMKQYYDTKSPAWMGTEDGRSVGFLGQYSDNATKGIYTKFSYPLEMGSGDIYTNWKVWAVSPPENHEDTLYHYEYERFTVVISFRMEEAPLFLVDESSQEVVFENTYFGPSLFTYYLQFVDGQWKIVNLIFEDIGTYENTPTPDTN